MKLLVYISTALVIATACTPKGAKPNNEAYSLNQPLSLITTYDEGYPLTEKEVDQQTYFEDDDYKQYYSEYFKDKKDAPEFNYNVKLSNKTFSELRLLRAEIFARHGFLFMDYVLRSHFNATKWYKPVFWSKEFKIKLNDQEKSFIAKVLQAEQKLYSKNYISEKGFKKANMANVVNWQQFNSIPKEMMKHLTQDGFAINKAEYEQLFHVYDENYYDYTPSFITTDLFLQVLHMHISKEMQALEEEKLIQIIIDITSEQYSSAKKLAETTKNPAIKKAASWNQVYYAVALSLISGKKQAVPAEYKAAFQYEYDHTTNAQERKSDFLGDSLMDYTQFQPRGNYTRTDSLKRYFKCVKWLNSASIYIDEDSRLISAILMANAFMQSDETIKKYATFSNIIKFLAGEENNLSFVHLIKILHDMKLKSIDEMVSKTNLQAIRTALNAADPKIMKPQGANALTKAFLDRKKVLFTAGRYTFDGEILQRLIHIARPEIKRPFPKGLDIFATMGNKTAEDILMNVYKEPKKWKAYPDTLDVLKKKFKDFNKWDISVYNKKMESILSLQKTSEKSPYFMQLPNWQKKNLNTMLSSWTELKHDMVLYIEQPSGAEMGDGGEIPPPQKIAYVEPQIEFWKKCIELLNLNQKLLSNNGLLTEKLKYRNDELKHIAELFNTVSEKELNGQKVSDKEFDELSFIGGEIESLTLNILESTETTTSMVKTPDRYMAVATDVYTYNTACLQETVGMGDEIYVVAEINGLLYLTRGAVFSHYEFNQPSSNRLTDEAWQEILLKHNEPKQEPWMNDIKISVPKIKTRANFNLY